MKVNVVSFANRWTVVFEPENRFERYLLDAMVQARQQENFEVSMSISKKEARYMGDVYSDKADAVEKAYIYISPPKEKNDDQE